MAYYLVRARPIEGLLEELRERLARREFDGVRPFGRELTRALRGARVDAATGDALWEEEDYCSPPLAQERAAVLDDYFTQIRVEPVEQGTGWARVEALPPLWPAPDA